MSIQVSRTPFPSGSNFDPDDKPIEQLGTVAFKSLAGETLTVTTTVDDKATTVFKEQEGTTIAVEEKDTDYTLLEDVKAGTVIILSLDGGAKAAKGANGKLRVGTGSQDGLG
ncbi:MAG: hypothetical protein IPL61_24670 [Myxococcales bacterium]|nr:hypothetical protein [Myxococcales bacterium]